MTEISTAYRWNTSAAAEAYDQSAPTIHPYYVAVQDVILDELQFKYDEPILVVDLGGGSGRLVERILARFTAARAVLMDQSEPFLALAERRLRAFGERVAFVRRRLQDDWTSELGAAPNAIVSTSAIHHLEPQEKRSLFKRSHMALAPGGLFINGDEYRPESDAELLAMLERWSKHMYGALDAGRIPASFRETVDRWHDRNISRFGEPKTSGDDCHETIAAQVEGLLEIGFAETAITWAKELWAVIVARKHAA
jgi:tRNA (cmo5U34)-methyltransferase